MNGIDLAGIIGVVGGVLTAIALAAVIGIGMMYDNWEHERREEERRRHNQWKRHARNGGNGKNGK